MRSPREHTTSIHGFIVGALLSLVAASAPLALAQADGASSSEAQVAESIGQLTIASAGGYRKPVLDIIDAYSASGGGEVFASFGNMQQVVATARAGEVAAVIGDERFLTASGLFASMEPIGQGMLVVAWPIGSAPIENAEDLLRTEVARISHPDPEGAIYGAAAREWLQAEGIADEIAPKLLVVATAPQVSAYLIAGEVDAGFINLTDAIGIADRIGGYQVLEGGYTPIRIVAATVDEHVSDPALTAFLAFLRSPEAREIMARYGL